MLQDHEIVHERKPAPWRAVDGIKLDIIFFADCDNAAVIRATRRATSRGTSNRVLYSTRHLALPTFVYIR